jgi:hypothetical protein
MSGEVGILAGVAKSIRRHLETLQFKQTGRDPKTNGYAYAEVPDWALRQWLDRIELAQNGIAISGSANADTTEPNDLARDALDKGNCPSRADIAPTQSGAGQRAQQSDGEEA